MSRDITNSPRRPVTPLTHFEGITTHKTQYSTPPLYGSALTSATTTSYSTSSEPIISDENKDKYARMFAACGPVSGLLGSDKAEPDLVCSTSVSLADTKERGSLDITDFTIAMFYIQQTMDGHISNLPKSLPASLLKAATGASTRAGSISLGPQPTSELQVSKDLLQSLRVGGQKKGDTPTTSRQSPGGSSDRDVPWEVTAEEKAKFDRYFDLLDIDRDGFVEEEAVPFFRESKLSDTVLAQIWDLADITNTGRLTKDEFAVAMHVINNKIAYNKPIPETLPMPMVPPSLRAGAALSKSSSQNDDFFSREAYNKSSRNFTPNVVEDPFQNTGSLSYKQQPSLPVDLFDLPSTTSSSSSQNDKTSGNSLPLNFFDLPLTTSSSSSSPQTNKTRTVQASGNQDLWTTLANGESDLTVLDTKLNQEAKVVKDLQTERAQLKEKISRAQDMRGMMEQRLFNLKTQKEQESKTIDDLKSSLASMESEMANLRMAIDVSKRELEIAQEDKRSFLKALAEGREESVELKASLQRSCDEVVELRKDLEMRMNMLGLDPVDFPSVPGPEPRPGPGGAPSQAEAAERNGRVTRGPQFVRDDLIATPPRQRNPEFRAPEPERLGRGPQDNGDFHGIGLSKPIQEQPWHFMAQQESLSREQ
ncbi:hypothetical protein K457DRAFT_18829 [Linnemannia elongata AG-77]|uniref:EF-hand n=1 Tax=Linnemannia elongata AG-77 TaxID=1314771 RepID=A0A197K0G3_9FUNG|nr:hypothetical protein K457DRAFT_18829 [Linnemannia elongata AG-77]